MENTTRNRILEEALTCFACNGYKGTNLRDLAARLDLSKSALYRHFDSKEAIWDSVIDMMESYYNERFGSPENMPPSPKSLDEFIEMTMRMIDFTVHDKKIVLTRQLLLTEQFHDKRACQLATKHFLSDTKDIYTKIFRDMMDSGLLKMDDPEMLAFSFTSPVTSLVHLCDREPENDKEIITQIRKFAEYFVQAHKA